MILLGIFLLALAPRVAYLLLSPQPFDNYYWELSTNLIGSGTLALDGVRTTRFEPLYPLFLAGARLVTLDHVLGVQLLQCGVASLGAVFLFLAARRLAGTRVAFIASALFAIHPLLIRHAPDSSDSALTTTTLLLFVWTFVRARNATSAATAGACLALCVLTRSVALPLLVAGPALLLASRQRVQALVFLVAALLVMSPMFVRNYVLTGALVPQRQGENLFLGNSEYTAALLPDHSPDILKPYANKSAAARLPGTTPASPGFEDKADPVLSALAWAWITAHPVEAVTLKLRNVWYFFSPFLVPSHLLLPETTIAFGPSGSVRVENAPIRPLAERIIFSACSAAVLALALAGVLVRRRLVDDGLLWCVLITFVAVYSLYFPATRYTAPVVPVLLFYGAVAIDSGIRTRRGETAR